MSDKRGLSDEEAEMGETQNKKAKSEMQYNVPVTNRWGILEPENKDDEEENMETQTENENTTKRRKQSQKWIPPVIIAGPLRNYSFMCKRIEEATGNDNFRLTSNTKETRIILQTENDRQKVMKNLKDDNMPFHSYQARENRTKKVVLKAAPNMDPEEIKKDLSDKGIQVTNCIKMKSKNPYSFSYLVTTPREENISSVKKIENVGHCKVKWETLVNRKRYTQCFRCQRFGHGALYCNNIPRCVKCGKDHQSNECTLQKTEDSKAKCCNCDGDHPANYSKCPELEEYLNQRKPKTKNGIRPPQPREFVSNRVQSGISYSAATKAKNEESKMAEINEVSQEFEKINEICDLKQMIMLIKEARARLQACKNKTEKMLVILELCENLDD